MIGKTPVTLVAATLAAAFVGAVPARSSSAFELQQNAKPEGVRLAYDQLLDALDVAVSDNHSRAARGRIRTAASRLDVAIKLDGGARDNLEAAVGNIVKSLADGTFDASRSIDALKHNAKGNAIEADAWLPETLPGTWVRGPIGQSMHQGGIGDCVGISVVKAFSTTSVGRAILSRSVKRASNGDFNVMLPGEPTRTVIAAKDTAQFGAGDAAAGAIIGALFKDFGIDPKHGALPTNKAMALLSMGFGSHRRLWDAQATPQKIEAFLVKNADHVGRDMAMVFGGTPGKDAAWSRGDGHAFAVLRIDVGTGMVTYTNPWDETRERTIPIATLARQAAGTSADFETVTFDTQVLTAASDGVPAFRDPELLTGRHRS